MVVATGQLGLCCVDRTSTYLVSLLFEVGGDFIGISTSLIDHRGSCSGLAYITGSEIVGYLNCSLSAVSVKSGSVGKCRDVRQGRKVLSFGMRLGSLRSNTALAVSSNV